MAGGAQSTDERADLAGGPGIFLLVAPKLAFRRHRLAKAYDRGFRDSLGGWDAVYPLNDELKWAYVEGLWAGTQVNGVPLISSDPLLWLPGNCRSRECFLVGIPHSPTAMLAAAPARSLPTLSGRK